MAFAQGTITRLAVTVGDDEFQVLTWTDTEAGTEAANTEGSITNLPILFRILEWRATASASTINSRFMDTAAAAIASHSDLGVCATTAIQINEELNALMVLLSSGSNDRTGTLFYRDRVAASTATVQHTMIIKAGS